MRIAIVLLLAPAACECRVTLASLTQSPVQLQECSSIAARKAAAGRRHEGRHHGIAATQLQGDGHPWSSFSGVPKGIRTPVTAVKGRCPGPLDDGDNRTDRVIVVELRGIEPRTSCMPCKRSPS